MMGKIEFCAQYFKIQNSNFNLSLRLCVFTCFISFSATHSYASYSFNANCIAAYNAAWSMHGAEVNSYLNLEKRRDRSNLIPQYISNLAQFVNVFSNENKAAF